LSLEDNLMRIFASDRISGIMRRLGMKEGEQIVHPLITKAIENAQRKLEGHYFDIRKQLLSFDNVANEQRKVIYSQRAILLELTDLGSSVTDMCQRVIQRLVNTYIPLESFEDQWQIEELTQVLSEEFFVDINIKKMIEDDHHLQAADIQEKVTEQVISHLLKQKELVDTSKWNIVTKAIILETLDLFWREHLQALDYLRQGIHLRGYAQKDPKQEYKKESFHLFTRMLNQLEHEAIANIMSVHWQAGEAQMVAGNERFDEEDDNVLTLTASQTKLGRNDLCHCGSGEKFKNCHGRLV
jgi:preprotein translocase subunit SecA